MEENTQNIMPEEEISVQEESVQEENVQTEQTENAGEQKDIRPDISERLENMENNTDRLAVELRELRKLYHNEYAGRLRAVQEELDHYHTVEKGRLFDDILRETAHIYTENIGILERIDDEKIRKQLSHMFSDILQLIESSGASVYRSNQGDKRNPRYCQIVEKIPTGDQSKHDTVAESLSDGFYIDNRPLAKELINVYSYSAELSAETTDDNKEE